ncbi:MAG: hypothetical protein PHI12_07485 [Dehalococcoidales bacterium]|nr:hypothetical protein [Dehalococcoidales bacterium]
MSKLLKYFMPATIDDKSDRMQVHSFVGPNGNKSVQFTIGMKYCDLEESEIKQLISILQKRIEGNNADIRGDVDMPEIHERTIEEVKACLVGRTIVSIEASEWDEEYGYLSGDYGTVKIKLDDGTVLDSDGEVIKVLF